MQEISDDAKADLLAIIALNLAASSSAPTDQEVVDRAEHHLYCSVAAKKGQ